jgi:hypothetical protein
VGNGRIPDREECALIRWDRMVVNSDQARGVGTLKRVWKTFQVEAKGSMVKDGEP